MTEKWNFWKYEGNGNDFILILLNPDNTYIQGLTTSSSCLENYLLQKNFTSSKIEKLCDRHYGIGADGVIFLNITKDHDGNRDYEDSETDTERKHESAVKCRMKIYNSDGTIAKLCGNGLRCVVKFLHHHHHPNDDKNYDIMTDVGLARALV